MAFSGDFTPVLAKHSKSFNLIDTLSVGVDRIQRNFEPMQRQVELSRQTQISVRLRRGVARAGYQWSNFSKRAITVALTPLWPN